MIDCGDKKCYSSPNIDCLTSTFHQQLGAASDAHSFFLKKNAIFYIIEDELPTMMNNSMQYMKLIQERKKRKKVNNIGLSANVKLKIFTIKSIKNWIFL